MQRRNLRQSGENHVFLWIKFIDVYQNTFSKLSMLALWLHIRAKQEFIK